MVDKGTQCDVTGTIMTDDSQKQRFVVTKLDGDRSTSQSDVGTAAVARGQLPEDLWKMVVNSDNSVYLPKVVVTKNMTPLYVVMGDGGVVSGVDMNLETIDWLEDIAKEANK